MERSKAIGKALGEAEGVASSFAAKREREFEAEKRMRRWLEKPSFSFNFLSDRSC